MAVTFIHGRNRHEVHIHSRVPLVLTVDGQPLPATAALTGTIAGDGDQLWLRSNGRTWRFARVDPRAAAAGHGAGDDEIRAPMPGATITLHAAPGDRVVAGQTIVTIESMKLHTALPAPRDGVLLEIATAEGATFDKDAVLARLAPLTAEDQP